MTDVTMPTGSAGQTPEVPRSVFITGAGGFIGRALAARYKALGAQVRGMDLIADPANDIVFVGIIQRWAGPSPGPNIEDLSRALTMQALVDPAK